MAQEEKQEDYPRKISSNIDQYPLDENCYKILDQIGGGVSAVVFKAICVPMNSCVVAIKVIDLEKSQADFDYVRHQAETMTLLCHPSILKAHCSFSVESRLWVVMPFISGGSLQSIIASSFPQGLTEPCIATVLKEILSALSYLHGQGHLHRDIKAGNILIDSDGSVKLADFGFSASIYDRNPSFGSSGSSSLSSTDVVGTSYWMAPEVMIDSYTGYTFKADIWSFGITALELAHGRPPLSHLPPSKSSIMKITMRFQFSDRYEKTKDSKSKKFSKSFKDMVGLCLNQDPSKRPSAERLLNHPFFKNCKGPDFLVKNVLQGLPHVEQRFRGIEIQRPLSLNDEDEDDTSTGENVNQVVKQVTFGGETIIPGKGNGESSDGSNTSSGQVEGFDDKASNASGGDGITTAASSTLGGGVDKEVVLDGLLFLNKSLDDQRQQVGQLIASIQGDETAETSREEQLMQVIEKLRAELENEKKKRVAVEMELESLKSQLSKE
ncbi:hypothetical protein Pfo_026379 [Paulownia fortunei]|nr:hypothetical protein Pfo_026379 [Paulownia fortunei]